MKKLIILLLLSLIACNKENVGQTKDSTRSTEKKDTSEYTSNKLYLENEKIALIAIKNNIASDTASLILNSYYIATENDFDSELEVYEKIIDSSNKS